MEQADCPGVGKNRNYPGITRKILYFLLYFQQIEHDGNFRTGPSSCPLLK